MNHQHQPKVYQSVMQKKKTNTKENLNGLFLLGILPYLKEESVELADIR